MGKTIAYSISENTRLDNGSGEGVWSLTQLNKDQTLDEIKLTTEELIKLRDSIDNAIGDKQGANKNAGWNPMDFIGAVKEAAEGMNIGEAFKNMSDEFSKTMDEAIKKMSKTKYFVSYMAAYGAFGNLEIETEKPVASVVELEPKLVEALKELEIEVTNPVIMFYREV